MLSEYDIDKIYDDITKKTRSKIYYVAHNIERREGVADENIYKSVSDFCVVEIYVSQVKNALFEYLNYLNNPSAYAMSYEDVWYDRKTKYRQYYIMSPLQSRSFYHVQQDMYNYQNGNDEELVNYGGMIYGGNGDTTFRNDSNTYLSRTPSIIYGYQKGSINMSDGNIKNTTVIESPIKPLYTNNPTFLGESTEYTSYLNWKYKPLDPPTSVDGIEFRYTYSDWYILVIDNFARTEDALVKVNDKNAYFINLDDAFNHIDQLKA